MLYGLITGERAFAGANVPQVFVRVANEDPAPPSSPNPAVPPEVDLLLKRTLAKRKEDRLASAEILANEIQQILAPAAAMAADATQVVPVAAAGATKHSGAESSGLPPGKRILLAATSGPESGGTFPVLGTRISLGRKGGDADIQVNDPEVSRAHAALCYLGDRFELQDLNSTNGTFIADDRIEARTLEDQDEFRIGASSFVLVVADDEPP